MARNRYFEDEELKSVNPNQIRRVLSYLKPYKLQVVVSLVLMLVASLANLMGPYLTKIAIDEYIGEANLKGLLYISLLYISLLIINSICLRVKILIMSKIGHKVIKNIRKEVFDHIQSLSFSYFDSIPAGKIIVRVMNNVNSLQNLLENGLINIITELFTFLVILIIMLSLSFRLTLIALVVMPFLVLGVFLLKKKIRIAWRQVQKKDSNLNAYIHESITGMKIIKSFVRENKNSRIMKSLLDDGWRTWMKAAMLSHGIWPLVLIVNAISAVLVYLVGIDYLAREMITVGVLIALLQYLWRLWQPIINLSNFYNQVLIANSAAERVFDVLDTRLDISEAEDAIELPEVKGNIEFKDVTFSYEKDVEILTEMNFKVSPGETIAFVGETGAGKSTIINLLTRFYDIDEGKILIDDIDIRDVTIKSLRNQIGVMMQDTFIFSGSILDNIKYGKLNATKEEIIEVAKKVYLHQFITEMEDGYETEVNERGSRLSVGQRQLISFARTLLSNPNILILDEATSSIDTQTEMLVQKATDALLENRTSFVIAHRLSTIRNADRIIVIDEGEIIEVGSHDQLMEEQGAYYELYQAQYSRII